MINNFFKPKTVAVIGASNDKNKVGYAIMANLSRGEASRQERQIFPVSLAESEVLGYKTYKDLEEIKERIDLVVIAIKADFVPKIVEQCAKLGIKSVAVISAGFKEMDSHGAEMEQQIAKIAKENGISLLGPNCLGSLDCLSGLNATFAPDMPPKGKIAFISQSGALGTAIIDKAISEGLGFSKFVSLGNEASLNEIDFLEYIKDDPETEFIMMYLEKISDGPKFLQLTKEITKNKPIVVIKAGRGKHGQKAVMSHTGSLASDDIVMRSAFKQAGIIVADSIRQFFNIGKILSLGIKKPLTELVILTNAGGPAVVTSDLVDISTSLSLVNISNNDKEQLKKVLPPMTGLNNPVDIIGDALSDRYDSALKILCKNDEYKAIAVLVTPQMMTDDQNIAKIIVQYAKEKTLIPIFIGGKEVEAGTKILIENKLVNFNFPADAIEALDKIALNQKKHEEASEQKTSSNDSLGTMLSYKETTELFANYDLHFEGVFIKEKDELRTAFTKMKGDSFILKAISPQIIHKTELGAVIMNIKNLDDAENAWDNMIQNLQSKIPNLELEGMVFQAKAEGKETIIGMKRDSTFGASIVFGLGGIFTEALGDTSLRIAPISKSEARTMIQEIKGFKILNGLRGEKAIDFDQLSEVIAKISLLTSEHDEIMELDLNPVMVRPDGVSLVDVRVGLDTR